MHHHRHHHRLVIGWKAISHSKSRILIISFDYIYITRWFHFICSARSVHYIITDTHTQTLTNAVVIQLSSFSLSIFFFFVNFVSKKWKKMWPDCIHTNEWIVPLCSKAPIVVHQTNVVVQIELTFAFVFNNNNNNITWHIMMMIMMDKKINWKKNFPLIT